MRDAPDNMLNLRGTMDRTRDADIAGQCSRNAGIGGQSAKDANIEIQHCPNGCRLDCFGHPTGRSQVYKEFKKYTSETTYNWKLP